MYNHILIRYGELSLKKSNRNQFVRRITDHIKKALESFPDLTYESRGMRYYIYLNGTDYKQIFLVLKKIPGIYSFSLVSKCDTNIEQIKELAVKVLEQEYQEGKTFKVESNRGDKDFNLTSLEITQIVSRELFKRIPNLKADMHNPDLILNIDARVEGTFIFTKTIMGLGGFPSGILGKVLLMISGGIDSTVAGYEVIKKGMDVEAIHFASPPYTSDMALQKVVDLLETLVPYVHNQKINLHVIPFTDIQKTIYDNVREDYGITIMRRMMYRISEKQANNSKALAIVNGESIGQVASQTLESIMVINQVVKLPVIRPLATSDKKEIISIANTIGSYDISIRPYEDCCTVFVPRHPQIKPKEDQIEKEEAKFDYQTLIDQAIENKNTIVLTNKQKYQVIKVDIDL